MALTKAHFRGLWAPMAQFKRTGITNLIRHENGTYYLQAKITGQKVRRSLKTKSKDLARHILPQKLQALRAEAVDATPIIKDAPATILDFLENWKAKQMERTDLELSTKGSYMEISKWVAKRFPKDGPPSDFTEDLWREVVAEYSPGAANKMLAMLRAIGQAMADAGHLPENPFQSTKQLKARDALVDPLSLEQMQSVIESIRSQKRAYSEEAADFVAVLAFSGIRVGQARALKASDVMAKNLKVRAGVTGSKGASARMLPLNRLLGPVLRRRVAAGCDPIFTMHSPREALANALERLGLPPQRIHDLRHFFATYCIEQGVDIPTVSRWLGHKDGGVLAMKTYGHLRDEHSQAMARLI